MGFLLDGLEAEPYDRTYTDGLLVRRIVAYFRPQARQIAIVAVAIVVASIADTLLPIYISSSIDRLQADPANVNILLIGLGIAVIGSVSWIFNYYRRRLSARAIADVVLQLREDAFNAVTERDLSFYDTYASGKIVSRVTSDTEQFSKVVSLAIDLLSQCLLIVLLLGYLLLIDVQLSLMVLALAPLIILTALGFRRVARYTITQSRRANALVNAHVQETISGISVAKTFRQEKMIYQEFQAVNRQSFWINLRSGYVFSGIFPILSTMSGIGTAAVVYFGGQAVERGSITAGSWYLFVQGLALFWFPLTSIASFWSQFQLGLAAGERVFALLDAEPNVVQKDHLRLTELHGAITFSHVDFRYNAAETVLKDFSIDIAPGEALALVGHTGSGKSSIVKLIARFYEFQRGQITIDGQDIRTLDLGAYRSQIGYVTQSPFLFDGSVLENIRYSRPTASDEMVRQIAGQVGGGDWLNALPDGLETPVGERGSNLSMGQRQLVALSRVLLQNPSVFILDEATASIDPFTEAMIQEGLDVLMKGRTSIVIAHRLSTVRQADRIVVLRKGEIIEQGNHNTLLRQGGYYAELYNTYFRHQSISYIEAARDLLTTA